MPRNQLTNNLRTLGLAIGVIMFVLMIYRTSQTASDQLAAKRTPHFLQAVAFSGIAPLSLSSDEAEASDVSPVTTSNHAASASKPAQSKKESQAAERGQVAKTEPQGPAAVKQGATHGRAD